MIFTNFLLTGSERYLKELPAAQAAVIYENNHCKYHAKARQTFTCMVKHDIPIINCRICENKGVE